MRNPILIAITLLLITALCPSDAMDCGKAKSDVEQTICGDAKLKAEDAALSRLYFRTLRGLKGPRHDLLIADQRRWLGDGQTICADRTKGAVLSACVARNLAQRQREVEICFGDRSSSGPFLVTDHCPVFIHTGCPDVYAGLSTGLTVYPWLVHQLDANARQAMEDFDCSPATEGTAGTPDLKEWWGETLTLLASRPNVVSVHDENDEMWRGTLHPQHGESITSYDTQTGKEIRVTDLLPGLTKPGSNLLKQIDAAGEPTLDPSCCFETNHEAFDHTFKGLDLESEQPMSDGWAVAPDGDLILAYGYRRYDRSYVARATVPRKVFIDAVAPKYTGLFVPAARSMPP